MSTISDITVQFILSHTQDGFEVVGRLSQTADPDGPNWAERSPVTPADIERWLANPPAPYSTGLLDEETGRVIPGSEASPMESLVEAHVELLGRRLLNRARFEGFLNPDEASHRLESVNHKGRDMMVAMVSVTAIVDGRLVTWTDGKLSGSEDDVRALQAEDSLASAEGADVGHVMGPRFARDFLQHEIGFLFLVHRLWPGAEIRWNTPEPSYSVPDGAVS